MEDIGCDFLLCSPYKFFGPHQGFFGEESRMEELPVAKLRVSTEEVPFRWMTGLRAMKEWREPRLRLTISPGLVEKSQKRRTSEKRGLESSIHCYRRA